MTENYQEIWRKTAELTTLRNEAQERLLAWSSLRNRLTILYSLYKNEPEEEKLCAHIDKDIAGAQDRINTYEQECGGYDKQLERLTPVLRDHVLNGDAL